MHKICTNYAITLTSTQQICILDAQNMQNARNMQCIYMYNICKKYVFNMQIYAKLCINYAFAQTSLRQICKKKMQKICSNMPKKKCKQYANNIQNMHKSMYWHILHIYALPTLLMPPTGGAVHCHCKPPECQCHGLVKVIEPVTQQLQVMIWNPVTLRLDKSELPLKTHLLQVMPKIFGIGLVSSESHY